MWRACSLLVFAGLGLLGAAERIERYLIHYSALSEAVIAEAHHYDLVIIHPGSGDVTRAQVAAIQQGFDPNDPSDDVLVLGYISVGEDIRTVGVSDADMLLQARFVGDGSGPRVDPRGPDADGSSLAGIDPEGDPSPGGTGYASYYLDDNSVDAGAADGKPDRNGNFGGAFVNAGDPTWFPVLQDLTIADEGAAGFREILTTTYGRGLGCDGVFLDTIDTCAPNSYTASSDTNQSEFEWTAPGFADFLATLRQEWPQALVVQNRGLFFYDPDLPQFDFHPGSDVDFVFFESYRLDSSHAQTFHPTFYPDNRHRVMPKLMAEAGRPDGFQVLSMGYAEGPAGEISTDTLTGGSSLGLATLLEDIQVAEREAGFRHYITDDGLTVANDFVRSNAVTSDSDAPVWSSTWNDSGTWPPAAPTPRPGIHSLLPGVESLILTWDVALDYNPITYRAWLATSPFDFAAADPFAGATALVLDTSQAGPGYIDGSSSTTVAHQMTISGLAGETTWYVCIRARDSQGNEDANQVVLSATTIAEDSAADADDGLADGRPDWAGIRVSSTASELLVEVDLHNTAALGNTSAANLLLDLDDDAATGFSPTGHNGVGSELLVQGAAAYGQATGVFNDGGLGAVTVETVDADTQRWRIPRSYIDSRYGFAERIRVLCINDTDLDFMPEPDRWISHTLSGRRSISLTLPAGWLPVHEGGVAGVANDAAWDFGPLYRHRAHAFSASPAATN